MASSRSHGPTRRAHSSHNLASHRNNSAFHFTSIGGEGGGGAGDDSALASTSASSNATAALPSGNRRRQSGEDQQHQHHHPGGYAARLGPKRRSRVGISGMGAGSGLYHAGGSSSALSRKGNNKSRSHNSLANLANEIAMAYDGRPEKAGYGANGRIRSRSQVREKEREREREREKVPPKPTTDEEEGWVSASSSKTGTPEMGSSPTAGIDAPATSPSSYQPLEFGKKQRRKPLVQTQSQIQLERPPSSMSANEEHQVHSTGTTPKQDSMLDKQHQSQTASQENTENLRPAVLEGDEDAITPTQEPEEQEGGLVDPPTPRLPPSDGRSQAASEREELPPNATDAAVKANTSTSESKAATASRAPRPPALRKPSTSTIRSNLSLASISRPPLTPGLRRQTAALQPRLDTSVEGYGAHTGQINSISPSSGDPVPFPSAGTSVSPVHVSASAPRSSVLASPRQRRQSSTSSGTPQGGRNGTNSGTLTSEEADALARRLRSVSGGDLRGQGSGSGGSNNRSGMKRSVSTASTASLANVMESHNQGQQQHRSDSLGPNSGGGGAMSTLKRASGYFGSIGRLTALGSSLGFTSTSTQTSPTGVTTPASAAPPERRQVSPLTTAPQTAAGSPSQRVYMGGSARGGYAKPPLVSKFIDPSEFYTPFPKASTSQSQIHSPATGHRSSRARQKLMTQRDAPSYSDSEGENDKKSGASTPHGYKSATSDDDASQLNIRSSLASSANSNRKPLPQQVLQPGVQRWINALVKEAERIDKDHETTKRFHNSVQASMARVLEKKLLQEEEARREDRLHDRERARGGNGSRPPSIRSKTTR